MTPHDDSLDDQQMCRYDEIEEMTRLRLLVRELEDQSLLTTAQMMRNCLTVARYTSVHEVNKRIEEESTTTTHDPSLELLRSKQSEELAALLSRQKSEMAEATNNFRRVLNHASAGPRQESTILSQWYLEMQQSIERDFKEKQEHTKQRRKLEDDKLGGELLRAMKGKIGQTLNSKVQPTLTPSPTSLSRTATPLKSEKRKHVRFDAEDYDSPLTGSPQSSNRVTPTSAKRQRADIFSRRGDILNDDASSRWSPGSNSTTDFTSPQVRQEFAIMQLGESLPMSPPASNVMSSQKTLSITPTRKPGTSPLPRLEPAAFDLIFVQPAATSFEVRYIKFIKLDNEPSIWNKSDRQTLNLELQNGEFRPFTQGYKCKWHLSEWVIYPSRVWSIKTNVLKSLVQINRRKEGMAKAELWVGFRDSQVFSAFIQAYKARWPETRIEEKPDLECPKMFVRIKEGEWK